MLADLVLALHLAFVVFVVGGFGLVLAGAALGWAWVRSARLRAIHLAAMALVALESLAGIACPLTLLENALRAHEDSRSFIGRWVARLVYYELPEWLFVLAYVAFLAAVVAAWFLIPPRQARGTRLSSAHHD
ncbi:MAG: DUF2784 domain-containing protein [Burkholderiales bacterium]|nr:DUF2784 domain-containing protein [Burkholderiales bacterium]